MPKLDEIAFNHVAAEYARASNMFGAMASAPEGAWVLQEEWEELKDEVYKFKPKSYYDITGYEIVPQEYYNNLDRMREEATQVAAMAVRFLVDICGESLLEVEGYQDTSGVSETSPVSF